MQESSKQNGYRYYLTYLLWYSLLFILVTAGVFLVYIVNDRCLVWGSDAVSQYVPKAAYFGTETRQIFADFLNGKFEVPLYDFALGMGNTVPFHFEPLYWLFLLFDATEVENAFELVLLVRFYLAGLSMSVFILYFKNTRTAALVGSMAYLYCDYGLYACLRHAQFVVPMIMLPLAILCMEEIYQKKRWYFCTILVWIHLWCGYYFLYMDTLAMGVYFLIRFFAGERKRSIREFLLRMRTIICSYLLGVAIGNITLVNSFASYLSSSRTEAVENAVEFNYLTYGLMWPLKFFRSFMTAGRGPGNWLRLGFIPLIFTALIVLFLKKGRKNLKIAVLTGTIFCMMPSVAYIFSGFGNINNRWSYIYSFTLAAVLAFVLPDLQNISKKEWCKTALLCLPSLLLFGYEMMTGNRKARNITAISAFVLLLTLSCLWLFAYKPVIKKRTKNLAVVLVTAFSLCCFGIETYSTKTSNLASEFPKNGTVYNEITHMPLAAMEEVEDDSFHRAATFKTNRVIQGAAQILDYNGTVYYSSTSSKIMQDFYKKLGLCSWSLVRLKGFDGRSCLDTLASVKYFCLEKGQEAYLPFGYHEVLRTEKYGKELIVYENELALPIGYTYDKVISEKVFDELDLAYRQEVMMQAAVLEEPQNDAVTKELETDQIKETGSVMTPSIVDMNNVSIEEGAFVTGKGKDGTASLTIEFEPVEEAEIYLYIKGLRFDSTDQADISYQCNDAKYNYGLHGARNTYYTGQEDFLFHMGYHPEKTDRCTLTIENGIELEFEELLIYQQPVEELQNDTQKRKEQVLEQVEISTNKVSGKISLPEDKLLVLSIPSNSGWTAYVDGEKTELLKANLMYMALPLTAGEHTVELYYRIPGLTISLIISAAGIIILIAALVIRRKRKNAS